MSHCEWKPIEEADKFGFNVPIYVWQHGELVEAEWSRNKKDDDFSWCTSWTDGYDTYRNPLNPQPKYYLAVTPPPEG